MKLFLRILSFLVCINSVQGAISYYETPNYRSRADNPFLNDLGEGVCYVENFENQGALRPRSTLTTSNATGWNGVSAGTTTFWGVQQDNLGLQPSGKTWSANGSFSDATKLPLGIHFDFTPDEQGRLPDYAGAALLGRFDPNGTGLLFNSIFVYDKEGNEVTAGEWKFIRPSFAAIPADPADYFLNFYGVYVPGGISRIHFRDYTEVDHLTYGYSIPEISTIWLTAGVGILLLRRKRQLLEGA